MQVINDKKEHFNQIKLSPKLSANDIEDLKKGHVIMTNMLKIFDKICRNNNLKYWCLLLIYTTQWLGIHGMVFDHWNVKTFRF